MIPTPSLDGRKYAKLLSALKCFGCVSEADEADIIPFAYRGKLACRRGFRIAEVEQNPMLLPQRLNIANDGCLPLAAGFQPGAEKLAEGSPAGPAVSVESGLR